MKSAPKDRHILLCYPSFSDPTGKERFVNQGRWVEHIHTNHWLKCLQDGRDPAKEPVEGRWEIGYVAIMQHGGAANGFTFEERSCEVDPIGWMPLPDPKRA